MKRILWLLPFMLIGVACSDKPATENKVESKLPIELVDGSQLTGLLADYKSSDLALQRWHDVVLPRHSNEGRSDLKAALQVLKPSSQDIFLIKPAYEAEIEKQTGQKIRYNSTSVKLADMMEKAEMQCFSGTLLHLLLVDTVPSITNRVAIFEAGHILPGFLVQEAGTWMLYGIETTASGTAKLKYGAFKDVSDKLRVVDSTLFWVVEAVKYDLKNGMAVANAALQMTGSKYGASNLMALTEEPVKSDALNYSPFQFGRSNPRPGPQDRPAFEEMDRSNLPQFIDSDGSDLGPRLIAFRDEGADRELLISRLGRVSRILSDEQKAAPVDKEYQALTLPFLPKTVGGTLESIQVLLQEGEPLDPATSKLMIQFLDEQSSKAKLPKAEEEEKPEGERLFNLRGVPGLPQGVTNGTPAPTNK